MSDLSAQKQRPAGNTIGLLTTFIAEANIRPQWAGFVETTRRRQVSSIAYVGGVYHLPEHMRANFVFDLAQNNRTNGLVIWTGNMLWHDSEAVVNEFVTPYLASGPVVCCEKPAEGATVVLMDDYEGTRAMVRHLIEEHNRRRIVFLQGPGTHLGAAERYRGYCDALTDAGILFDAALVSGEQYGWNADEPNINNRLSALGLTPGLDYDAVVGVSCFIAMTASRVLQKQGIAVPEQVSVVGFDDVTENLIQSPTLTTVQAPFYEMAQRATETVLDLLDGQTLDPVVTQPVRLVIRQSCGCLERLVTSAAISPNTRQPTIIAGGLPALIARRESWLPNITQAFLAHADSAAQHVVVTGLSGEVRHLVDAFLAEVTGKADGVFLKALRSLLQKTGEMGGSISAWQAAISALRHFLLPYLDPKTHTISENLWNQSRVLIGDAAERHQISQRILQEQRAALLRDIANSLIAANNIQEMMTRLADNLSKLGIPGCYVALCTEANNVTNQARLVLAYEQGTLRALPEGGRLYPARQLLPDDLFPSQRVTSLLVEPLYFEHTVIGFVIFEVGPLDASLYETLRLQLSNALHKVLLVQAELDERIRAEQELRREQVLFQSLMENLPDVIYYKDRESRFTRVNSSMAHYHGFQTNAEIIGKNDFDLFDDAHARPAYEDEQRIMQTGQPLINFEEKEIYAGGRVAWVSTSKFPLYDSQGQLVGTFGISRDITASKLAEEQVERRNVQLQTAAEVARAAGSILDTVDLFNQVVDLIRDRFDLYYVGLFLVDETGEWSDEPNRWAVLRAGTGEAGQQMLAQGHKLELGETSMIGWCVEHRQPRIALDVGQDAVHFRNPHLPLTRSELALPLISRGQALGALSIQSAQGEAFTHEDITIFQVMADQLANAIANARLYEATQEALHEMQATNRRYARQGWEGFTAAHSILGYQQTEQGLIPLGRQPLPEVRQAIEEQQNLILQADNSTLVVPITLRDQPIGAVGFRSEQVNRHWTQEELDMIEVLTEQFALAAENLRLLDETQRRAERERLTANITAHIRESLNIDTILRTTVQDIQQALGLSEVVVRLSHPETQPVGADALTKKETGG